MEEAKAKKTDNYSKDRISKLPEEILRRILCSLSQKEAIQTCVLSKAWRYLGCTRPKIDIYFGKKDDGVTSSAFLDRILRLCHDRNLRLDEFALRLSSEEDNITLLLQKWIPNIIQNMCVKTFQLTNLRRDECGRFQLFRLPSLIIESHHIQNLSLHGCTFESSSLTTTTHEVLAYLKHLQTLSLDKVCIPEEILDNILSNCPFLEDVSLEYCKGFNRIKLFMNHNNKLTKLARFYLKSNRTCTEVSIEIGDDLQTLRSVEIECCLLSFSNNKPLEFAHHRRLSLTKTELLSDSFPCHFTTLFLHDVYIPEETLDSILSDCPFLEELSLLQCSGFKRIKMLSNKPTNLAHFYFHRVHGYGPGVSIEIGDHIQTLRSIKIYSCLLSVSHNKPLECARLTRLSLYKVKMLSESFSCNLHNLEELKLKYCYGIKEFNLSSRSMKRLSINYLETPFKATIDAPSMVSFINEGSLPQSISFASTSGEWKSKIKLGHFYELSQDCFHELYGLLKAIKQSEIYLELDQIEIGRLWRQLDIGSTNDHELPVVVEHFRIQKSIYEHVNSSDGPFLNMVFHMFLPSFVYMSTDTLKDSNNEHLEIVELLFRERETAHSYFWQRGLEEVSLQVLYLNQSEWQAVQYTSFRSELCKEGVVGELELRIKLKWRE